ncbi:MAG: hypothetical protein ACPGRC_07880 [Salibacteraceae bacterium]
MLKKAFSLILIISALGYSSCKKEEEVQPPSEVNNHITFNADGDLLELKFSVLLQDPVFNAYYVDAESIDMQRLKENGNPQRLVFALDRIDLENTNLPITIHYSTNFNEPTVSVTYVDDSNTPFGTNTNNGQDFMVTINEYSNNVINCSFNGTLYSGNQTNPSVEITNGEVNLELMEY